LDRQEHVNIGNFDRLSLTLVALHCQLDKSGELEQWLAKTSDYTRSRMTIMWMREDIWKLGANLNGPASPENLDARKRFLQNLLQWFFDRNMLAPGPSSTYFIRGSQSDNFFKSALAAELFTADELISQGAAITAGIGTKQEPQLATAALATWLQSDRQFDRAAEVWRSIIKLPDEGSVPESQARYVCELASCLQQQGRPREEVLDVLTMLNGKRIPPQVRGRYPLLLRQRLLRPMPNAEQPGNPEKPADVKKDAKSSAQVDVPRAEPMSRAVRKGIVSFAPAVAV
jgi:hypothetical protein